MAEAPLSFGSRVGFAKASRRRGRVHSVEGQGNFHSPAAVGDVGGLSKRSRLAIAPGEADERRAADAAGRDDLDYPEGV
jgi:hypothetical protein